MLRAVLDTNVFVAALISPDGVPAWLMNEFRKGRFELIIGESGLNELEGVLFRDKFRQYFSKEAAGAFVAELRASARLVTDPLTPAVARDEKDDFLVAIARLVEADALVSGDDHLLELEGEGLLVMTPRQFADRLRKDISD